ncbi:MAG: hypothetical protein QOF51_476, partial [Chloroflexota bacterium]|nr:hypothetical protein [Chloroflexota bacterium]
MEVPTKGLELRKDPRAISPPIVVGPLYQCGTVVQVRGYIPQATLDLEIAGGVVIAGAPGGFPEPNGAILPLPSALVKDRLVRARQHFGGVTSDWGPGETVRDHTVDYPAGPPRPVINPAPVFDCGSRTGVGNLLAGANVWITAAGAEVGRVNGAIPHQGVNVAPDYGPSQDVLAWSDLCGDPSPASATETTQLAALPLPAPSFEDVIEGAQQVVVNGLVNGCRFMVKRSGADQGPFRSWGGRTVVTVGGGPIGAGEPFEVWQWLCPSDPQNPHGTTTAFPCTHLGAPTVGPIQDGDTVVTLLGYDANARIQVFINLMQAADGSGPVLVVNRAIHHADTVHVLQMVGPCVSATAQEIRSACVAPPVWGNPAWLNLFPVGFQTYDGGPVMVRTNTTRIHGTVYYPAERDAEGAPFYQRLAKLGPVPMVFLVHGRHGTTPPTPSYLGYDYLQRQLAQMGMVAVSVDCVDTDAWGGAADNIHDRAELVLRSIAFFQNLNATGDPLFGGHLDFGRVGLMGHSRGGDAVVTVPEMLTLPGVVIQAVLALAPVNFGSSSGRPHGYPYFLTILPAYDGDVVDLSGATFYDQATASGFRCQLFVEHANHNHFNRQWPDDTGGGLALMARPAQEAILSAYGCALFRHALLGQNHSDYFIGKVQPAGVHFDSVQHSFAWGSGPTTVDHFDDGNTIGQNSLGRPNTQAGGMAADEFRFAQAGGSFNGSFFGNTTGMVASPRDPGGTFRFELAVPAPIAGRELWVRAAEVYDFKAAPAMATSFEIGVERGSGARTWLDVNEVGGLALIQDRRSFDLAQWYATDKTKTMPKTL